MTVSGRRGKFRVELTGKEPGVIWQFHSFYQCFIRRQAANDQPGLFDLWQQVVVDLIAVTMALFNLLTAVDLVSF